MWLTLVSGRWRGVSLSNLNRKRCLAPVRRICPWGGKESGFSAKSSPSWTVALWVQVQHLCPRNTDWAGMTPQQREGGPWGPAKHEQPAGNSQCCKIRSEAKVKLSQQGDGNGPQLSREKYRTEGWLFSRADSNHGCQPRPEGQVRQRRNPAAIAGFRSFTHAHTACSPPAPPQLR